MSENNTKPMAEWTTAEHSEHMRSGRKPLSDEYLAKRSAALTAAGLEDEPGPARDISEMSNEEVNSLTAEDFLLHGKKGGHR